MAWTREDRSGRMKPIVLDDAVRIGQCDPLDQVDRRLCSLIGESQV